MIIIGIDPGTIITGFGIIKIESSLSRVLDFGTISPPREALLEKRYLAIFTALEHLINKFKPDVLSIETQFVNKNVQSAIKLGMARGVCVLAAAKNNVTVKEYSPTRTKKAIVGKGHASKQQMQHMVKILLKLDQDLSEDEADALALALCHFYSCSITDKLKQVVRR